MVRAQVESADGRFRLVARRRLAPLSSSQRPAPLGLLVSRSLAPALPQMFLTAS